jgi:hypothetical protein
MRVGSSHRRVCLRLYCEYGAKMLVRHFGLSLRARPPLRVTNLVSRGHASAPKDRALRRPPRPTATSSEVSAEVSAAAATPKAKENARSWLWFRRAFRVGRTVFLATSLYWAGHSAGMHEYAMDPRGMLKKQIKQATGDYKPLPKDSPEVRAVARVFPRLLAAARMHVKDLMQAELGIPPTAVAVGTVASDVASGVIRYKRAAPWLLVLAPGLVSSLTSRIPSYTAPSPRPHPPPPTCRASARPPAAHAGTS